MKTPIIYFLIFFASFGLFPIDKLIHWGFHNTVDRVLRREEYRRKKRVGILPSQDMKKQTMMVKKHTGFAFSQEAG